LPINKTQLEVIVATILTNSAFVGWAVPTIEAWTGCVIGGQCPPYIKKLSFV